MRAALWLLSLLPLASGRSVVGYNMTLLARAREGVQSGAPGFAAPWASLQAIAHEWLSFPLASVVQKTVPSPPGASIHDYNSWPTYYWRCNQVQPPQNVASAAACNTTTGVPLSRHDGYPNYDDIRARDLDRFANTSQLITDLSLAYYFSSNETYAVKAGAAARTWFLDPATRQLPTLEFAQYIPGCTPSECGSRGIGIIDYSSRITQMLDGLVLIEGSTGWSTADGDAMSAWVGQLLQWQLTSTHGGNESAQTNNHGTWYDVNTMTLALYTGNTSVAARIAAAAPTRRLDVQIAPDGELPLENARANSLG